AHVLRFNFDLEDVDSFFSSFHLMSILPAFSLCFWKSKTYAGILRHSTSEDVMHIISATLCAGLLITLVSFAARQTDIASFLMIPFSVIIIHFLLVTIILILSRLAVKMIAQQWFNSP